jgi:hypothetical protein
MYRGAIIDVHGPPDTMLYAAMNFRASTSYLYHSCNCLFASGLPAGDMFRLAFGRLPYNVLWLRLPAYPWQTALGSYSGRLATYQCRTRRTAQHFKAHQATLLWSPAVASLPWV